MTVHGSLERSAAGSHTVSRLICLQEIPVSHGSYFWYAHKEGLLAADHANIVRIKLSHFCAFELTAVTARWYPQWTARMAGRSGRLQLWVDHLVR